MNAPLSRIVGMSLVAVDDSGESCAFAFDGCTLSGFNPVRSSPPVRELIQGKVREVVFEPGKRVCVRFDAGGEFSVSLADADYTGPEAFVVHFSDGTVVAV